MVDFFYYNSKFKIKVGDTVEIKRFLRKNLKGKVSFVFSPNLPSPPKGDNPVGYSVKIKDGTEYFFCTINKSVIFLHREQK